MMLANQNAGSTIAFTAQGTPTEGKGQVQVIDRSAGTGKNQVHLLVVATGTGRFEDLAGFRASVVAADPRSTRLVLQVVRGDTAGTLAMQ